MGEKEELRQEQPSKMSYEQLENVAHQLSEQVKQLYMSLQKSNLENTFQRLNYLFKVVENGHAFKPDFLNKCTEEIENKWQFLRRTPRKRVRKKSKYHHGEA